jgi:hypothetical protein
MVLTQGYFMQVWPFLKLCAPVLGCCDGVWCLRSGRMHGVSWLAAETEQSDYESGPLYTKKCYDAPVALALLCFVCVSSAGEGSLASKQCSCCMSRPAQRWSGQGALFASQCL